MDSFEGLPNWLSNRGAGVLLHPSSFPVENMESGH